MRPPARRHPNVRVSYSAIPLLIAIPPTVAYGAGGMGWMLRVAIAWYGAVLLVDLVLQPWITRRRVRALGIERKASR